MKIWFYQVYNCELATEKRFKTDISSDDEGRALETSVLIESLYGGQFTLLTQFIK